MSTLTEEQRKRIEENRRKALEKRALKCGNSLNGNKQTPLKPVVKTNNGTGFSNFYSATVSSNSVASSLTPVVKTNNGTSFSNFYSTAASSKSVASSVTPVVKTNNRTDVSNFYSTTNSSNSVASTTGSLSTGQQTKPGSTFSFLGTSNSSKATTNSFKPNEMLKGQCVLISRKRFSIDIGYNKEVIEICKSIPGRSYDMQTKKWNFPIETHDKLISLLKPLQPNILVIPLPRPLVKTFIAAEEKKELNEYDLSHMDQVLVNALLPFQKLGLYFGIQHGGRVLLADDMGLGKTIQGIAIANYFIKDWPLLVVTPSSVRYSWLEAFHTWLPSVEKHEISILNSSKEHIPSDKVIIMSYDLLSKMKSDIINRKFKSIIIDESHFLKNHKSARTKAAQAVMKNMNRIVMLSGTPALSRPIELFTQISALCPQYFSSHAEYGMRYCNGKQTNWGWDFSGSSNMTELQILLQELVMIRRLKSDVIKQLPSKVRQMVVLDPSRISNKSKIMKAMYEKLRQVDLMGMERRGALLEYFHETGNVKIPAVCDYILDLLESERKFICFAHHQNVLNSICECAKKKNFDFIRIDGSVSAEKRKKLCDHFQLHDTCKVAVLSITSANCGITLTAASLVVFAELFWNPGILTQAEDRAHRIGQEDSVLVQYLVAKGTADDEIWPLVQRKLDTLNKAGLSKDNFKSADTIVKDDSSQMKLEDLWGDLESSEPPDIDIDFDIPEKRLKFDL